MITICPVPGCGVPLQPAVNGSIREALTDHFELVHWFGVTMTARYLSKAMHPTNDKALR